MTKSAWSSFSRLRSQLNLHSFPTRRSSDLDRPHEEIERVIHVMRIAADVVLGRAAVVVRSEEHTSELQSHSDLVCRLLLEKKKTGRRNERRDEVADEAELGRKAKERVRGRT